MPQLSAEIAGRLSESQIALVPPLRAHLVGICGSGMKALAELLSEAGWTLTGSDQDAFAVSGATSLTARGLKLTAGHHPGAVPEETQLLVYSPAIPPRNAERIRAAELGIVQISYNDLLGSLMQGHRGLVVAGTHGKSTTTALLAHLLLSADRSPSVIIGAETRSPSQWSGRYGSGIDFIAEGCEYRRNFLKLPTQHGAILGIEPDHFDYFSSFDDTIAAFREFAEAIPASGSLTVRAADPAVAAAVSTASCTVESFSLTAPADWSVANLRRQPGETEFQVLHRARPLFSARLRLPGLHNVENALAAIALATRAGVPTESIARSLPTFSGIRRRFEIVRREAGITWIDDYAHHPTAIRATLRTVREEYPSARIRTLFQPHQTTRTEQLMDQFAASFVDADEILVAPVFGAREQAASPQSSAAQILAEKIAHRGQTAAFVESLDLLRARGEDGLRTGDVVVMIGAGDINRIQYGCT